MEEASLGELGEFGDFTRNPLSPRCIFSPGKTMAELTIRLRVNPETGKKDIVIDLRSDADALPHEHEQQHRHLVQQLIEGGVISEGEVGQVIVERESEGAPSQSTAREDTPQRQSEREGQ